MITDVRDHGACGDGTTDDLPAIEAAIAAAGDGVLYFPPGSYRCGGPLRVHRSTRVVGAGRSGTGQASSEVVTSRLVFDEGCGLVFDSASTSIDGGSAMGSHWSDLEVTKGGTPGAGACHGIDVKVRVTLERVTVSNFGGHGVYLGPTLQSEATECEFYGVQTFNNLDGIHIECGNASVVGGRMMNNRGCGLLFACVFGCSAFGVKFRGNPGGLWATGPIGSEDTQGQHAIVGCSVSGGNGKVRLGAAACWFGGPSGAGFDVANRGMCFAGNGTSFPFTTVNKRGLVQIESSVGADSTAQIAFQWRAPKRTADGAVEDEPEYRLAYDETPASQRWVCKYMGGNLIAYELTAKGHSSGPGRLAFPHGYFVGSSSNARLMTTGLGAPAVATDKSTRPGGAWVRGDRILNINPVAGGTLEWVCVTSGLPGAWKAIPVPV